MPPPGPSKYQFFGKNFSRHADRSPVFRFAGGFGPRLRAVVRQCRAGRTLVGRAWHQDRLRRRPASCWRLFRHLSLRRARVDPADGAQGTAEEEAALTLAPRGSDLPDRDPAQVKWALLSGVLLCNARAMGEFGAVSVVSGHIRGLTNTIPLQVEILYNEYSSRRRLLARLAARLSWPSSRSSSRRSRMRRELASCGLTVQFEARVLRVSQGPPIYG